MENSAITTPAYFESEDTQTSETFEYVEKVGGDERVELLQERERILKEAPSVQFEAAALLMTELRMF